MAKKELSSTAYLICWARSKYPGLSCDKYAHLWLTKKGEEFAEKFCRNVTLATPYLLSMRSRYIVKHLKDFEKKHSDATIINIGAGLTSYPFLLNGTAEFINFDQPNVIEHYKNQAEALILKGLLPERNIKYKPIDLNSHTGIKKVCEVISSIQNPVFILFEGILSYLKKDIARQIVTSSASAASKKGSRLLIHFFPDGFFETMMGKKLIRFFGEELGVSLKKLTTFSCDEFASIPKLRQIDYADFKEMYLRFNIRDWTMKEEELLDERFLIFEKE